MGSLWLVAVCEHMLSLVCIGISSVFLLLLLLLHPRRLRQLLLLYMLVTADPALCRCRVMLYGIAAHNMCAYWPR
jgi:hypothetical protein